MRSGSGRHRRPRQVPAIVVAAGVTGASIAMPLLAASGASAADADTWDKVAQCESGGTWSANSGNGYSGGLQLTQEMWEQNGGTAYAPRPDLASRSQQITVAEQILKSKGPDAWPSCAVSSGLQKDAPAPEVNPGSGADGTTRAPAEPTRGSAKERPTPSTPAHESDKPSDKPSGTTEPTPGTSQTPGTPTPSDSSGTGEGGKHRKDPSTEPSGGTTTPSGTPSGTPSETPSQTPGTSPAPSGSPTPGTPSDSATPGADAGTETGTGKHRAEPSRSGDEAQRSSRGDARTDPAGPSDYTVRPGDNLSAIASEHAVDGGWKTIYQKNQKAVGSDPDLIQPGQRLDIRK